MTSLFVSSDLFSTIDTKLSLLKFLSHAGFCSAEAKKNVDRNLPISILLSVRLWEKLWMKIEEAGKNLDKRCIIQQVQLSSFEVWKSQSLTCLAGELSLTASASAGYRSWLCRIRKRTKPRPRSLKHKYKQKSLALLSVPEVNYLIKHTNMLCKWGRLSLIL